MGGCGVPHAERAFQIDAQSSHTTLSLLFAEIYRRVPTARAISGAVLPPIRLDLLPVIRLLLPTVLL